MAMLVGGMPRFTFLILVGAVLVVGTLFYLIQPVHLFSIDEPVSSDSTRRPHHPHAPPPALRLPPRPSNQPHSLWNSRAEEVKQAFLHAYSGYRQHAAGHDELRPVSNEAADNFVGWGVTLIDSLDTMYIMGLYDQFDDAVPVIANMTFSMDEYKYAPFFETVIRYLGGLLSAYALSNETILLTRADDLGQKLLPAFNTSTGMPMYAVNTVSGKQDTGWAPGTVLYSEALSCQMEYKYLAHLTGRAEYFEKVENLMNIVSQSRVQGGAFPTRWSLSSAKPINSQFSVGAFADSAHEYLLKQWLLSSQVETKSKNLYLRTVTSILDHLLYLSPTRHLLYVTDADTSKPLSSPSRVFEHLSCFLPGLLTLGAHTLFASGDLNAEDRDHHQWAAEGLANTCWVTYTDHVSGLGPDEMRFSPSDFVFNDAETQAYLSQISEGDNLQSLVQGRWLAHVNAWEKAGRPGGVPPGVKDPQPVVKGERDYVNNKPGYYLRPETVESFYLLYRTTGDVKWRERGWAVFSAIQKETRTSSGYASITTVEQSPAPKMDEMPSFFLAETLKYLYLLFHEDDLVPLDRWVFNTEAHPLPVFEWSDWEKARYGIP